MTVRLAKLVILVGFLAIRARGEDVLQATSCELSTHPQLYDGKLVEVMGKFTRGFEQSTVSSPGCTTAGKFPIWMDYGEGAMNWRDIQARGLKPHLVRDALYKRFDKAISKERTATARAVGRFVARSDDPSSGFGHLGHSHLFLIQQVLSVEPAQ